MAKKHQHGRRGAKHTSRDFKLEDARRLFVMRAFVVTIEKKLFELLAGKPEQYDEGVKAIRALLTRLDELNPPKKRQDHSQGDDCWDEYELCDDRICRVWCS